jgi:F-type H+-transporting ATPase subunit gamma
MKAMDLVAASKLQKAKARLDHVRPLVDNLKLVMDAIKTGVNTSKEVAFAEDREVKNIAYIIMTSDRGLCGGFNTNVSKKALAFMTTKTDAHEKLVTVGSKGLDYFRRRGKSIVHRTIGSSETSSFEDAEHLGSRIVSMYASGEIDEAYLVYTQFESILSHIPQVHRLLPIKNASDEAAGHNDSGEAMNPHDSHEMSYDPDVDTFISYAVPMYLNIIIYGAMMESAVCEYAARMTSMDAATRNAGEIIEDLTLEYNRKRQGMITQEITEIVSGANALK